MRLMTNAKLSRLIREACESEGQQQQAIACVNVLGALIAVYEGSTPEEAMVRFFDSPVWPNVGLPFPEQNMLLAILMEVANHVR